MLSSIMQLSLKSIRGVKLLRPVDLRSTIKCGRTGWVSRKPVAIVNEDELFDTEDTTKAVKPKIKTRRRSKASKQKEKKEDKKENEIEEGSATGSKYIALQADNKLIRCYIVF